MKTHNELYKKNIINQIEKLNNLLVSKEILTNIIDIVYNSDEHLSVSKILLEFEKRNINVDKNDVIFILNKLNELGYGKTLNFDGLEEIYFEHTHPGTHHDHFICTKCNNIFEFTDDELEDAQDVLMRRKGFKILNHKFELYGICAKCLGTETEIMTLASVPQNHNVNLIKIDACLGAKKRLVDLGFIENEKLNIIKNSGYGPVVVEIRNSRFALGRKEAAKIFVKDIINE